MDAGTITATLRLRDEMTATLDKANRLLAGSGGLGDSVKTALATFGGFIGAQVAIDSVKSAFQGSLGAAIDFNAQMANVASLIPNSSARVDELKLAVQNMAIATGKSTADLAGGLYQVVSAFGNTADSAAILETNARAAAAGVATTTDAINLTSAVTKGYGDTSAKAVKQASDLALMTVRLGQTTFPELASAMGTVTPVAAALKVSQAELFAVLSTLTGVTGSANAVTTQLRGAFVGLQNPTKEMSAALKQMGFSSGEAALESLGLKGTLDGLLKVSGGNTNALVKLWSATESWASISALAGAQSESFTEKMAEMSRAAGTTDVAFKEQTEGINKAGFAWEQMKQRVSVAMQKLGDEVLPKLLRSVDAVVEGSQNVLSWWDKLPASARSVTVGVVGFTAAAWALHAALVAVSGPAIVGLGASLASLASPLVAVAGLIMGGSGVAASLSLLVTPLAVVAASIASLGAVLYWGYQKWNLWNESAARGASDRRQAAVDTANLARISEVAGIQFGDLATATAWARRNISTFNTEVWDAQTATNTIAGSGLPAVSRASTLTAEQMAKAAEDARALTAALDEMSGKSARDAAQKTLDLFEAFKKLNPGMEPTPAAALKIAQAMTTMGQSMSVETFTPAVQGMQDLLDQMTPLADEAVPALTTNSEFLKNMMVGELAPAVVETTGVLEDLDEAAKAANRALVFDTVVSGLDALAAAFDQAGSKAGAALATIGANAVDQWGKATSGGEKFGIAINAVGQAVEVLAGDSKFGKATASALKFGASGAALGTTILPGIGTAIGAAAGAIVGFVSSLAGSAKAMREANQEASKEIAKMQGQLVSQYGSLANIDAMGKMIGVDLKGAWGDQSQAGLAHFSALAAQFQTQLNAIQSASEKYGITWKDMSGEWQTFSFGQLADGIRKDWDALFVAGVDGQKAIRQMAPALYDVIKQSEETGLAIPENLQPIIAKLLEMEQAEGSVVLSSAQMAAAAEAAAAKIKADFDANIGTVNGLFVDLGAAAALTGQHMPARFDAIVLKMQDLGLMTEDAARAITGMQDGAAVDFKAMEEAAKKYGIGLSDLGPAFQQAKIGDTAKGIWNDFQLLTNSGANADSVLKGMGGSISGLVNDAIKFGTTIPEQFKPLIAKLVESGGLIDGSGKKLTDVSGLKFGGPIVSEFDKVALKIDELITKLASGLGIQLSSVLPTDAATGALKVNDEMATITDGAASVDQNIKNYLAYTLSKGLPADAAAGVADINEALAGIDTTINVSATVSWTEENRPEPYDPESGGNYSTGPGFASGTFGRFLDFGAGTPVVLHGRERVVTEAEGRREAASSSMDTSGIERKLDQLLNVLPAAMARATRDAMAVAR